MNDISEKTIQAGVDNGSTQVMAPATNATQAISKTECPVCHTPNPPSEIYCIDCGFMLSAQPVAIEDAPVSRSVGKLVTSDGTREFDLNPGENTVGREGCDVLLSETAVSRRHAKITVDPAGAFVEDLGSTNGTTVGGRKIAPGEKTGLADGCDVVFGTVALKFEAGDQAPEVETPAQEQPSDEAEASTSESPDENQETAGVQTEPVEQEAGAEPAPESEPAAVAMLVSSDGAYSFKVVEGVNTIGRRDGDNTIVVPDRSCSGRHADLSVGDGKLTLTDIGSTNGTAVSGVRLDANSPREIVDGDEITIGRVVFKIQSKV